MSTNRRDFLKLAGAAAAAITSTAAAHAGVPASSVAKFDDEYDVVIIGSGFAGMACALKAGQAGKKVLILEKMPTVGGNSAICGGNVACPVNPVQAAQGIKDSKELFIADCLKDGLGINYPNLLGTIADRCNDTIKMVVDCGCEFVPTRCSSKPVTPFLVLMKSRPAPDPDTSFRCIMNSRSSPTSRS